MMEMRGLYRIFAVLIGDIAVRINVLLRLRYEIVANITTLVVSLDLSLMPALCTRTACLRNTRAADGGTAEAWEKRLEIQGIHTSFVQTRPDSMLSADKGKRCLKLQRCRDGIRRETG